MNEISIHVSYIFGSKQNLDIEENTEEIEKDRGTWIQGRPNSRPYKRPERQS